MRTLFPRNPLFAAQRRNSGGTLEGWQFTIADVIGPPADSPDCLKRTTEHRPFARAWGLDSRPHDRSNEPLHSSGKTVIQVSRGSLALLARGNRTACGDSRTSSRDINFAREDRE